MADKRTNEDRTAEHRPAVLLALALANDAPSGPCPDAQDILAWHEEMLSGEKATQVEAHVARCEHCHTLWTGLLRTDPPAEVALAPAGWWRRLLAVVARPRMPAMLAGSLAAGLALVAVVNLTFLGGPATPPVPGYELMIQGRAITRGVDTQDPDAPVALRNGNRFSVILRPDTTLNEAVEARALIVEDGVPRDLGAPPPRIMDNGVIVFEGRVGDDVILPAGASTLILVGGRAEALPDPSDLVQRLDSENRLTTHDWVAWRIEIQLEP